MKNYPNLTFALFFVFSTLALKLSAQDPATPVPEPDFGDYTSQTLTTKSWDALSAKNYAHVIAYAGKCIELYTQEAIKMQTGLTAPASADIASSYWALNDVGACFYIRAMAYQGMGKPEKAKVDFNKLLKQFSYAQVWDNNGWFWKPADAAKQQLKVLEFELL